MGEIFSCCFPSHSNSSLIPKENKVIDISSKFKTIRVLGEGASCEVRECQTVNDNKKMQIALKRMQKSKANHELFEREVFILKQIKHKNIIQFIDCYSDINNFYIVTHLCTGGELFDRIVKAQKFTEKIANNLINQMLRAIAHCHQQSIAHRDLKPENFVFQSKSIESALILIDFGCAQKIPSNSKTYHDIVGTPYYLAPEYLRGKTRTGLVLKSADIWAIGAIAFILVTGQPPFNGKNNNRIFVNIVKQKVRFPRHSKLSKPLKDFILKLLNKNPSERPTALEALEHPWVCGKTKLSDENLGKEVLSFLEKFGCETRLKKKLAEVVVNYAPKKDIEKMHAMFDSVDKDGDGELDAEELAQVLVQSMGYYGKKALEKAHEIINHCDINGDGKLSFVEFSHIHASMQLSSDDMLIHTCFGVMDENGDGTIELKELQAALKLGTDEARVVFEEADLNGDGVISFEEFKTAIQGGFQNKRISKAQLISGYSLIDKEIEVDTMARPSFIFDSTIAPLAIGMENENICNTDAKENCKEPNERKDNN